MKVTYEKWLKSPFGTQGLPPENPRTRHIYIYGRISAAVWTGLSPRLFITK